MFLFCKYFRKNSNKIVYKSNADIINDIFNTSENN